MNAPSRSVNETRLAALTTCFSVHRSGLPEVASLAAVAARYSEPESTWKYPSRRATHWAVDDFPEAAGPSIAMTMNPSLTWRELVRGRPRIVGTTPKRNPGHRPECRFRARRRGCQRPWRAGDRRA